MLETVDLVLITVGLVAIWFAWWRIRLFNLRRIKLNSIMEYLKTSWGVEELKKTDMPFVVALSKFSARYRAMVLQYLVAGYRFGDATVRLGMMGPCLNFDEMFEKFSESERAYADAGYVPISLDLFQDWSWNHEGSARGALRSLARRNRRRSEVVLHAEIYRLCFEHEKDLPSSLVQAFLEGEPVMDIGRGTPSTQMSLKKVLAVPGGREKILYTPA